MEGRKKQKGREEQEGMKWEGREKGKLGEGKGKDMGGKILHSSVLNF